jgi:hypothetical protein
VICRVSGYAVESLLQLADLRGRHVRVAGRDVHGRHGALGEEVGLVLLLLQARDDRQQRLLDRREPVGGLAARHHGQVQHRVGAELVDLGAGQAVLVDVGAGDDRLEVGAGHAVQELLVRRRGRAGPAPVHVEQRADGRAADQPQAVQVAAEQAPAQSLAVFRPEHQAQGVEDEDLLEERLEEGLEVEVVRVGALEELRGLRGAFPEVPVGLVVAAVGLRGLRGHLDGPFQAGDFLLAELDGAAGHAVPGGDGLELGEAGHLEAFAARLGGEVPPDGCLPPAGVGELPAGRRLVDRDRLDRGHGPERAVGEDPGGARQERAVADWPGLPYMALLATWFMPPQLPDCGAGV